MRSWLALGACILIATPGLSFPGTKVNDSDEGQSPDVIAGPDGEWIVIYRDGATEKLARFDRDGNRVHGPVAVATGGRNLSDPRYAWNGVNVGVAYVDYAAFDICSTSSIPMVSWCQVLYM